MTKKYLFVFLLAVSSLAQSAEPSPEVQSCFADSARTFNVPVKLLVAIARVESEFNPYAIHYNTNGSIDIGLMQINSIHLPFLAKHGIAKQSLYNACTNIKVGAFVLAQQFRIHGKTWRAVGAYNARDESLRKKYVHRVWLALIKGN